MESNKKNYLYALKIYIDKMPSLPTSVTKIMEISNDPNASPADLNQVISLDPVLMGKVMKLINSAYYGLSQEVTSLVRAIIMLGINTVKNLALSTAVLANLGKGTSAKGLNMDGFWRHSLCVGVTSKLIAKKLKIDPKRLEEFFMAGLLHDIGKIPLNNRLADPYVAAMQNADREQAPLIQAEKNVMGIHHCEVAKIILQRWRLNQEIQDAVSFHHAPLSYEGPHWKIVYAVTTANFFANTFEIGFAGDRYPLSVPPEVFQALDVDMEWFDDIEDQVLSEIEKARIFLKIAT
ncbi:phosphohydrolase [Marispirochaeta aestuarii]|uniref:Phosphohydrolase n=1 Tax=Marispirochaeta aestuarii TaxID=1963862 RepID=A0A1Y1RX98_9SPIO|nr:HDOD domain-containing protein [Marispirochaeta aestuarii]ORC34920.1 phosphohydrolase [Marispirochaeta aestuarii]